jgi:hypothetical protein
MVRGQSAQTRVLDSGAPMHLRQLHGNAKVAYCIPIQAKQV